MKKIIVALVLAFSVLLVSCGGSEDTLIRGVVEDDTFTSEYLGVTFTAPSDDWVFATDEEISATMGLSMEELLDPTEFEKKILEMQNIYEMWATDSLTGSSVMILHENLSMVPGGSEYTVEEYFDIAKSTVISSQPGVNIEFEDYYEGEFAGQTFMIMESYYKDLDIHINYYCQKNGNYMTSYLITIFAGGSLDDIISSFSAVE